MDFKLNRKSISNIVFVIAVIVLLYPPSREWFMGKIAFSPSIKSEDKVEQLASTNWQLKNLKTTETINFKEFENKVVFINFWATWCPPCRAEMPMIQDLYNSYKNKVVFIMVTNENWEKVNNYFVEKNYDLPSYNSLSSPPENLTKTNSIPASYLIDKKGNIRISKVGAAKWNSNTITKFIDELVAE
jgi:thiol-disulfide isomerase/thioredoxin